MTGEFLAAWHNGALLHDDTCVISPADRGLLLGDGLFETVAVFNGTPVWLDEHLARLTAGAAVTGIAVDHPTITGAVAQVLSRTGERHGILRITLTRGAGGRGLAAGAGSPNLLVTVAPWTAGLLFQRARLVIATVRRNDRSPASRLKSLSCLDNILAAREAAAAGADDALMLNSHARIACSAIANVFLVEPGKIITPPLSEGVLPGIARAKILSLASRLGLRTFETPLSPYRARHAQGMVLTNSLRLVRPVTALDDVSMPDTPIADRLFAALCEMIASDCGCDPREAGAP